MKRFTVYEVQNVTTTVVYAHIVMAESDEHAINRAMEGHSIDLSKIDEVGDPEYGEAQWGNTRDQAVEAFETNGAGYLKLPGTDPA